MTVDLNIVVAVLSLLLCGVTFFCGRFTAAKNNAENEENRLARLETKDEGRLARIETILDRMSEDVAELKTDVKAEVARFHQRLDDHLRFEHGFTSGKREE